VRARSALPITKWTFAFLMVNLASAVVTVSSVYVAARSVAAVESLEARTEASQERRADLARRAQLDRRVHGRPPPPVLPVAMLSRRLAPLASLAPLAALPPPASQLPIPSTRVHVPAASGIAQLSPTSFNVERATVDRLLEQQAETMGTTRIVPESQNGKVSGVQLFGVRPDTLLGMLGFMNGDSVQTINGIDITSPEKALEAYAGLRAARELTVRLRRGGRFVSLRYHLI